MNPPLEDKSVLRKERYYVLVLAAIQVTHILDFVIMMPLGPMFMRAFSISPVEFASLVSSYSFSGGVVGFFGALYADHFDRKKFLLFNFIGFIIGTYLCAVSTSFGTLLLARIIAGAFGGILNANVMAITSDLIPFKRRGAAMGVIMSAFSISSILGVPLGLFIAERYDWHGAFYLICLIGVVFWISAFLILPKIQVREVKKTFKENLMSFKNILMQIDYLQSFTLTSMLGFGIFMIIPFIATYLVQNVGMPESELSLVYLVGGLFTIISARVIGRLCDRVGSFRMFRIIAIISTFPIFLLTNLPPVSLVIALLVTTFFTMSGSGRFIPAMTLVSAVVKPEDRGAFMGLENASRQLSAGLGSQVAGLIIGTSASGALTNYPIVGLICIGTSIVGIMIAFQIKTKFNLR